MFTLGEFDFFGIVIVPLLIFLSRILDQSLGSLRIIFVSKGMKQLAPIIGFFEVLIWLIVMSQILQNLTNYLNYFAYAAGFGMGNYVGIILENKIAMGVMMVRVIPQKDSHELVEHLRNAGYGITTIKANGVQGPVEIIFSILKRKKIDSFTDIVKKFNPKAFYTIEDVRYVNAAYEQFMDSDTPINRVRSFYKNIMKKK